MQSLSLVPRVLMALVFALAAKVQLNDPDPLPWFVVYTMAAIACLLSATGISWRFRAWAVVALFAMALGLATGCFSIAISTLLAKETLADALQFEEVREAGGLALVLLWAALERGAHRKGSSVLDFVALLSIPVAIGVAWHNWSVIVPRGCGANLAGDEAPFKHLPPHSADPGHSA